MRPTLRSRLVELATLGGLSAAAALAYRSAPDGSPAGRGGGEVARHLEAHPECPGGRRCPALDKIVKGLGLDAIPPAGLPRVSP